MSLVAISQRLLENETYPETRECLDVRWGDLCRAIGALPLVLPHAIDPEVYLDRFAPEGVILTGGNDLASASPGPLSERRDAFERRLLAGAIARKIPVLAVCRGSQLVAETFGAGLARVAGHAGVRHRIRFERGTRMGAAFADLPEVNSYHGWAPTKVPDGFALVAAAEDGTVEAFEDRARGVYAHLWHPEREAALTPAELDFYRALFERESVTREGTR